MALLGDYKKLYLKWLNRNHVTGSPELDALIDIAGIGRTAFGAVHTESLAPITQIKAHYGLLQNVLTVIDDSISGTTSAVDEKFVCESGTSSTGLASILTLRQIATRAGQGTTIRFSALFDTAVPDNTQAAGLITAENILAFAYIGENFGILWARDGLQEIQELTLTAAASGSENASITINDIVYIVPLTGNGILFEDAYEIAVSLNAQVPNHNFSSNGSTVVAQAVISGSMGVYDYSSDGDSAGAWVQIEEGADPNTMFIPQSSWNADTRLTGNADEVLNQQFNNTYQIQLNGSADFYIEDKSSKKFILVHRLSFMNNTEKNNICNATYRIGWISRNTGNTSNVKIQGEYAGGFIEGQIYYDTKPTGESNSQTIPAGSSLQTTVLILRNRLSFDTKLNRSEVLPNLINVSTESSKPVFFKLLLNPVYGSPVDFSYKDKTSSLVEISKTAVLVTGGLEVGSLIVESGAPQSIFFNQTAKTTTAIYPGATLAIVSTHQNGGAGNSHASVTFQEDL